MSMEPIDLPKLKALLTEHEPNEIHKQYGARLTPASRDYLTNYSSIHLQAAPDEGTKPLWQRPIFWVLPCLVLVLGSGWFILRKHQGMSEELATLNQETLALNQEIESEQQRLQSRQQAEKLAQANSSLQETQQRMVQRREELAKLQAQRDELEALLQKTREEQGQRSASIAEATAQSKNLEKTLSHVIKEQADLQAELASIPPQEQPSISEPSELFPKNPKTCLRNRNHLTHRLLPMTNCWSI